MFHKKRQTQIIVVFFLWLLFAHLALAELAAKTYGENCIFGSWHFWDEGRCGKKSVWLKKGLLIFKCRSLWMKRKPDASSKIISSVSFHSALETAIWVSGHQGQVLKMICICSETDILCGLSSLIESATDLQRRTRGPGGEATAGGAAWCWREDHLVALQLEVHLMKH